MRNELLAPFRLLDAFIYFFLSCNLVLLYSNNILLEFYLQCPIIWLQGPVLYSVLNVFNSTKTACRKHAAGV